MDHNKLWEILKEMGIPDYLTCLLKNLYADQEARVRTGHGTVDWFKSGKVYIKAVYCHHAYFNLYTEYIWRGKWQPLQYSCPENPHGERSLVGYSPWGHTESDMTGQLHTEYTMQDAGRMKHKWNQDCWEKYQ